MWSSGHQGAQLVLTPSGRIGGTSRDCLSSRAEKRGSCAVETVATSGLQLVKFVEHAIHANPSQRSVEPGCRSYREPIELTRRLQKIAEKVQRMCDL